METGQPLVGAEPTVEPFPSRDQGIGSAGAVHQEADPTAPGSTTVEDGAAPLPSASAHLTSAQVLVDGTSVPLPPEAESSHGAGSGLTANPAGSSTYTPVGPGCGQVLGENPLSPQLGAVGPGPEAGLTNRAQISTKENTPVTSTGGVKGLFK